MIPPYSHHDRADEAGSYADRLQADLITLSGMLDHYRDRDDAHQFERLRDRSHSAQRRLQAIANRLNALATSADPEKYPLSDHEHAALDAACALREQMKSVLTVG